jgi:hypothetical protein
MLIRDFPKSSCVSSRFAPHARVLNPLRLTGIVVNLDGSPTVIREAANLSNWAALDRKTNPYFIRLVTNTTQHPCKKPH